MFISITSAEEIIKIFYLHFTYITYYQRKLNWVDFYYNFMDSDNKYVLKKRIGGGSSG